MTAGLSDSKNLLPFLEPNSSLLCSQSIIQIAHLCLPFVLRDGCESFFNSSEAAVPDIMSVSLDLAPQALPSLLLVPETFGSEDECFSSRILLQGGFIISHPPLTLSLLEVLPVEDRKLCVLCVSISEVFVLEDISLVPNSDSFSLTV